MKTQAFFFFLAVSLLARTQTASEIAHESTSSVVQVPECVVTLADERDLASGQSGILKAVHVREGDRVKKGQLLAELDAAVPAATLAVAAKQAENDVNVRFAKLAEGVARAEYDSFLAAVRKESTAFSRIELKKMKLEWERSVVEIEAAQHEHQVNQLRRDEASEVVASYRIVAPMDGVISHVYKSRGEAVQVGETVLHCQNTDTLHVEADVHVRQRHLLQRGTKVRVVPSTEGTDSEVGTIGSVFFVGVKADLTNSAVRVLVEVDNSEGLLLAGTDATIEFPIAETVAEVVPTERD